MSPTQKGRGSSFNTPNRFERLHAEPITIDLEYDEQPPSIPTVFYEDSSRSVLVCNDSPDISYAYSLNPYRGCEHGCIYCYARPSHEYLGFSAGLDFESRILVKMHAPELLDAELSKPAWEPQTVALSGNTDCYQPVERKLLLTRRCLEVFLKYRNPVSIITKNALVVRDMDVLAEMASLNLVQVAISMTSLDPNLTRIMEPRTATPARRLDTLRLLAERGIPTGIVVAPVIPGLTDEELPAILRSASESGARMAGYTLLRLPGAVGQLFVDWLNRTMPDRAARVINRIKDTRGGGLSDSRFGTRMEGEGHLAKAIADLFSINARKHNLSGHWPELSRDHFVRRGGTQMEIFGHSTP